MHKASLTYPSGASSADGDSSCDEIKVFGEGKYRNKEEGASREEEREDSVRAVKQLDCCATLNRYCLVLV